MVLAVEILSHTGILRSLSGKNECEFLHEKLPDHKIMEIKLRFMEIKLRFMEIKLRFMGIKLRFMGIKLRFQGAFSSGTTSLPL